MNEIDMLVIGSTLNFNNISCAGIFCRLLNHRIVCIHWPDCYFGRIRESQDQIELILLLSTRA